MYTHTVTQTLLSPVTCSFPPVTPPHKRTHAQTRTSEGPMYVRALSKHSFGCYMLQLLPDGLGENILGLLFHWHTVHPPVRLGEGEREREWDGE